MEPDHRPDALPPRASEARAGPLHGPPRHEGAATAAGRTRSPRPRPGMKPWAHVLCLAAGIALFALVLREVDMGAVASAAAAFGITAMLAVLALYAFEFLADTAGWHLAVTSVPFDAGWIKRLFVARLVGEAVNAATPLAGMGGEPAKAWLLKRRHAIEYGESAASLVIARTVNLLALLPFAGAGLMLTASDPRLPGAYAAAAGAGLAVLAVATLAFFAVQRFRAASSLARRGGRGRFGERRLDGRGPPGEPHLHGRRPVGFVTRRAAASFAWNEPVPHPPAGEPETPAVPRGRIAGRSPRRSPLAWIEGFDDRTARFYTQHRRRFALALALAFSSWFIGALGVFVTMRFLGMEISVADAWVIESFTQLVRAGTFFIPASIGAQEGVYVLVAGALTGSPAAGLAAALIRRCRDLVWIAAGLAVGWHHAGAAARRGAGRQA